LGPSCSCTKGENKEKGTQREGESREGQSEGLDHSFQGSSQLCFSHPQSFFLPPPSFACARASASSSPLLFSLVPSAHSLRRLLGQTSTTAHNTLQAGRLKVAHVTVDRQAVTRHGQTAASFPSSSYPPTTVWWEKRGIPSLFLVQKHTSSSTLSSVRAETALGGGLSPPSPRPPLKGSRTERLLLLSFKVFAF